MKNQFDNLLSLKEASDIWKIDDANLRRAISQNKLIKGIDVKKFGKQWVVTRQSMIREYGYVPLGTDIRYSKSKMSSIYYFISKLAREYSIKNKLNIAETYDLFFKHGIPQFLFDSFEYYEHYAFEDLYKEINDKIRSGFIYVKKW